MTYIFFGSPEFAAIVLKKLIGADLLPAAVVTNPDRPVGRKKISTPPPVKRLIVNSKGHIEVLQPENLGDMRLTLDAFHADIFIVAAYAKILPRWLIDMPARGTIGVHPSLLPRYRGTSPIQSALLHGDHKTGVTLYQVDEKMDHGPILAQQELDINDRDCEALMQELAELGGNMLIKTLPQLLQNKVTPVVQNAQEATYTKKIKTEDGFIQWDELQNALRGERASSEQILRMVRAFTPEPGAYTIDPKDRRMKILKARVKNTFLELQTVQFAGKKPQNFTP